MINKIIRRINAYRNIPPATTDLYLMVRKYLPTNLSILEAGAHVGMDTYGLSKLWPRGRVYAVEPIPSLYQILTEKCAACKNVFPFNIALGDANEERDIFISGGTSNASSSLMTPTAHTTLFPQVTFDQTMKVKVRRIADWAKEENIAKFDLLWLDMQGYEVNALIGADHLLSQTSVIYTELSREALYEGMPTEKEYIAFLETRGFKLSFLTPGDDIKEGIFINTTIL